jgi:hypothetical protein
MLWMISIFNQSPKSQASNPTGKEGKMYSEIIHKKLGCYDFCHPREKSESYIIKFANGKTAEFCYKEENAPCLELDRLDMPVNVIEILKGYESLKFLFSSSWDHFGEKTHAEKISLCEQWENESRKNDCLEWAERYRKEADKLLKRLKTVESIAKDLMEEGGENE